MHVSILHDSGRAQHCYAALLTQEARTHVDHVNSSGDKEERVLPVPGAQRILSGFQCASWASMSDAAIMQQCAIKEFGEESGKQTRKFGFLRKTNRSIATQTTRFNVDRASAGVYCQP